MKPSEFITAIVAIRNVRYDLITFLEVLDKRTCDLMKEVEELKKKPKQRKRIKK